MEEKAVIRIGCPVWTCPQWRGEVYAAKSTRKQWLRDYSHAFNSVEGNSTFYGIPKTDTFKRWGSETADEFRFALKFPRAVSHELELVGAERETAAFMDGLAILHEAERLGPSFLQLGPRFGPSQFAVLRNYLNNLPQQFPYAVEVRHPDFFKEPFETELNEMLREMGVDRLIFDSRPLFSAPATDEIEEAAQTRKPRVPVKPHVTGCNPILRLIGRNDVSQVQPWIDEWADTILHWLDSGKSPFVFAHAPDDRFAPALARLLADKLNAVTGQRIETEEPAGKTQQMLF